MANNDDMSELKDTIGHLTDAVDKLIISLRNPQASRLRSSSTPSPYDAPQTIQGFATQQAKAASAKARAAKRAETKRLEKIEAEKNAEVEKIAKEAAARAVASAAAAAKAKAKSEKAAALALERERKAQERRDLRAANVKPAKPAKPVEPDRTEYHTKGFARNTMMADAMKGAIEVKKLQLATEAANEKTRKATEAANEKTRKATEAAKLKEMAAIDKETLLAQKKEQSDKKAQDRTILAQQRVQAREARNESIRGEQDELWANRKENYAVKYPKWTVYTPSALKRFNKREEALDTQFAGETDVGKRQTLIQTFHELQLAKGNAQYHISRGRLFNAGGSPIGTGTKEVGAAVLNTGIGALAASGPVGEATVAIGQLAMMAAKAALAVMDIPKALTSFTGSIVSGANPAISVYKNSQLQALRGGGSTSNYRQWWDLKSAANPYNSGRKHPMMIGPNEMTKYMGGMALPQASRNTFAQQISRMVYNSKRYGGSLSAIPFLKTLATSAPGYDFNSKHAQVQGPLADLLSLASSRGQDVNQFYQAMGKDVGTLNGMKSVAGGNGASLMSLASSMSGGPNASQQQYSVANTMGSLVSGEQALYGGKFSNSALNAGQMMFLQKRGGIKGLMKNSRYASLLAKQRKITPDLYKMALSNNAMGMVFMNEALHGSKLDLDYTKGSIGMLGLPKGINDIMMGNAVKNTPTFGERVNRSLGESLPSGSLLNTAVVGNTKIPKSNSNMWAAANGNNFQEMKEFSGAITSLVQLRIIPQLSSQFGALDGAVKKFTSAIENATYHIVHSLKAS